MLTILRPLRAAAPSCPSDVTTCLQLEAGTWTDQFLPPYFWGVGTDIVGTGTVYGCGVLLGWLITLDPTITIIDNGARLAYSPAVPGNWSTLPETHAEALDLLAAAVLP